LEAWVEPEEDLLECPHLRKDFPLPAKAEDAIFACMIEGLRIRFTAAKFSITDLDHLVCGQTDIG
jgi:hypothetical protein